MNYRDLTVYDMPPPSQGLVALAFLRRLESWTRDELEPGPQFARRFGELRDVCYRLRALYITDPDFRPVPQAPFLDPDARGDTVYLCSADEHGNVVSLIQSIAYEFGSGIVADGTGVLLQNRGCYFSLDPRAANRLEPNKRTMHTLIPALAARDGQPVCAFGTMAGEGQPQIRTQVAINLFDRRLGPAEAVAAPRIRVAPGGEPLWAEADYAGAAALGRGGAGRAVELVPPRDDRMGHAQAIFIDGPRAWRAGADPRSDGSVAIV
jgi:gamma-glutamyltranspeptidase/glutathione hydrolase